MLGKVFGVKLALMGLVLSVPLLAIGCGPPTVQEVISSLESDNPEEVAQATEALIEGDDAKTIPALVGELNSDSEIDPDKITAILVDKGEVAVPYLLDVSPEEAEPRLIANTLAKIGDDAVPEIIEALSHNDSGVRAEASMALAITGDIEDRREDESLPLLLGILKSNEDDLAAREAIIDGLDLYTQEDKQNEALIAVVLDETAPDSLRSKALSSLDTDSNEAKAAFASVYGNGSESLEYRLEAGSKLKQSGGPEAVQTWNNVLYDKEQPQPLRTQAVEALWKWGNDPKSTTTLIDIYGSSAEDTELRASAGKAAMAHPATKHSLEVWRNVLWNEKHPDNLQVIGAEGIAKHGSISDLGLLISVSNERADDSGTEADNAIGGILARTDASSLSSAQTKYIAGIYGKLIVLGKDGSEPILVEALKRNGNPDMGEMYLNCENETLVKAAESWFQNHGYEIYETDEPIETGDSWGGQA